MQTIKHAKARIRTTSLSRVTKNYWQARTGGMGICVGKREPRRPYFGEWAK